MKDFEFPGDPPPPLPKENRHTRNVNDYAYIPALPEIV